MTSPIAAYFEYLDGLQASGVLADRFIAPDHLQHEFGLSDQDASKIFALWAKTFSKTKSVELRVVEADSDNDD